MPVNLPPALRGSRRLQMELFRDGVPEIAMLGRYNLRHAEIPLKEHTHGDRIEICYLVKGRQTYQVDGRNYHLKGGDVFVAFPNEVHGSAGKPEEKGVLYWIMLRRTERPLFGLEPKQADLLWHSLCALPARHFPGTRKMHDHLNALTTHFHGPRIPLRSAFMISEALAFMLEVLCCAGHEERPGSAARPLGSVFTYMRDHLEEPLSVPDLAAQAGLSTPRFKARFKEETGVPPGEYLLRLKIDEANKRLASGRQSVTEIAHGLGFSSSQYFATVYKRFTGNTPGTAFGMAVKIK